MALELKIEVTERAANCSGFTVADTTGLYDAADNMGGYGDVNPERAVFAAVLLANRVNSSGSVSVQVTPEVGDAPSTWNVATPQDGYYDLLLVLANEYNPLSSYQKNQVKLYKDALYRAVVAVPVKTWGSEELDMILTEAGLYDADTITGAAVLDHIAGSGMDIMTALAEMGVAPEGLAVIPASIEEAGLLTEPTEGWVKINTIQDYPLLVSNTGAYFARKQHLAFCHTEKCRLNRDTAFAASDCSGCNTDDTELVSYYKTERAYKGAIYNFGMGNYVKAGDQIEKAEAICKSKTGGCNC